VKLQGRIGARRMYNLWFWEFQNFSTMEAERLNSIANRLTDLQARCIELRRYL
jgi:hypothetical protein